MKKLILIAVSLCSLPVLADSRPSLCADSVEATTLKYVNERRGWTASTESRHVTASRPLYVGAHEEAHLVAICDEVEPSEWMIVVDRETCKVVRGFVGDEYATPSFPDAH